MAKETKAEKAQRIRDEQAERRAEEAAEVRDAMREEAAAAAAVAVNDQPKKRVAVIEDGHTVIKDV